MLFQKSPTISNKIKSLLKLRRIMKNQYNANKTDAMLKLDVVTAKTCIVCRCSMARMADPLTEVLLLMPLNDLVVL